MMTFSDFTKQNADLMILYGMKKRRCQTKLMILMNPPSSTNKYGDIMGLNEIDSGIY